MKRRRLGKSGLEVGEIGLGCMSLPEGAEGERIVHAALHAGVTLFDTADLYGQGANEELLGRALQGYRHEVVIATKVGHRFTRGEPDHVWEPSRAHILSAVEDSLRRLRTDYIDLYQLHGGTLDDPFDEIVETLEELVRSGRIRAYGISSIRPNVIRRFAMQTNIATVMMQYSLLDRRPEEAVFALLDRAGISVIVRGPVAGGLLSHRFADKLRDGGYLGHARSELAAIVPQLEKLAGGCPLANLALRFALAPLVVGAAVPGASSAAQLAANLEAAEAPPLAPELLAALRDISPLHPYEAHR